MKQFLLSAIKLRKKLIDQGKGHINGTHIQRFMNNLEYWIANGADCNALHQKWDNEIRLVLVPTWIKKYELLKQVK